MPEGQMRGAFAYVRLTDRACSLVDNAHRFTRRTSMPFLELSLPCTEAQQPRFERALEDVGALAVTLADAHADAPDEQAIFEPGVGEQPLWGELVLTALFSDDTDALILLAALEAFDGELDWTQ